MRLWLVKNNVPYDVAFALDHTMLFAHWITLGNFERPEDGKWNFKAWNWNKPRGGG